MKNQRRFSEQFYHVSATNPSTRQFPTQLYLSSRKTAQRYELTTLSAPISQCNLHKPHQNQQQLLHFPALGRNNGCSIQTQISFHPGVESSRLVLFSYAWYIFNRNAQNFNVSCSIHLSVSASNRHYENFALYPEYIFSLSKSIELFKSVHSIFPIQNLPP